MMEFLADENVESQIVDYLRSRGIDIVYMTEHKPGSSDDEVCALAISQNRILITNDKDFGEIVFRKKKIPAGVLLMRFVSENMKGKIESLQHLFECHSEKLKNHFTVISEHKIRIRPIEPF